MIQHFSLPLMPTSVTLPDAMPDVAEPTLLVVCDSHHCRFINAGGRSLVEKESVESKERHDTDRESQMSGPTGMTSGSSDRNQFEDNRLKTFANDVVSHIASAVNTQKVTSIYLSAPGRVLSEIKHHLSKPQSALLSVVLDGTFVKESALDLLIRFRPDILESAENLRDQENYSPAKRPPKK